MASEELILLFGTGCALHLALALVAFAAVAGDGFDLVLLQTRNISIPIRNPGTGALYAAARTLKYSLVASSYSLVIVLGWPPAKCRVRPKIMPEAATPSIV